MLVIGWVWKSIPRFGPLIPDPTEGARDFQEHLHMTGRFFARQDMTDIMIEPVMRRVQKKLLRYRLDDGDESGAEWSRLAATTDVPEPQLRWALETVDKASKKDYCQLVKILQRIDHKL